MRCIMWEYINESPNRLLKLLDPKRVVDVISEIPLQSIKNLIFIASGSSNNICRAAKNFVEENTRMNVSIYFPFECENDKRIIQRVSVENSLVMAFRRQVQVQVC